MVELNNVQTFMPGFLKFSIMFLSFIHIVS
jgi:hypothetical protein